MSRHMEHKERKYLRLLFKKRSEGVYDAIRKMPSKELKSRSYYAIRTTMEILVKYRCTAEEVVAFLGKYANRYNISLTIPMIRQCIDSTISNNRRSYSNIEINPNWDVTKRFLLDDIKTLKQLGIDTDEIIKIFDRLLLPEYFTTFEKKIAMSIIDKK